MISIETKFRTFKCMQFNESSAKQTLFTSSLGGGGWFWAVCSFIPSYRSRASLNGPTMVSSILGNSWNKCGHWIVSTSQTFKGSRFHTLVETFELCAEKTLVLAYAEPYRFSARIANLLNSRLSTKLQGASWIYRKSDKLTMQTPDISKERQSITKLPGFVRQKGNFMLNNMHTIIHVVPDREISCILVSVQQ